MNFFVIFGFFFVLFLILILIVYVLRSVFKQKSNEKEVKRNVLLSIRQTRDANKEMSVAQQAEFFQELVQAIVPTTRSICFEIAIPYDEKNILFFVSVPAEYVESVRVQIRRIYTHTQVEVASDYTIFAPNCDYAIYDVAQKEFFGLPLKTHAPSNTDIFASIVGAFSSAAESGVGMVLQLVVQAEDQGRGEKIRGVISEMKDKGKTFEQAVNTGVLRSLGEALGSKKEEELVTIQDKESTYISRLEQKAESKLYHTNIRVAVATQNKVKTNLLVDMLKHIFSLFGHAGYNGLSFEERKDSDIQTNITFRLPNKKTASLLTGEEIASVFHLYNSELDVEHVEYLKTKQVLAPKHLPQQGVLLGDNMFQGKGEEIYLSDADRLRHLYIIGQTGTGKTSLAKTLAFQDLKHNRGGCIIDPHGDFVDDLLSVVPAHRLDDIVLFDVGNLHSGVSINMLEYDTTKPEQKSFIVDELLSIFKKMFADSPEGLGPVFIQYMQNSLYLIMEGATDEPATLLDVPRVLTDSAFRADRLSRCTTDVVKRFWIDQAEKAQGRGSLAEIAPYITSKFSTFITNEYVRPIIDKPFSSINFRDIMDSGKFLFVKLPQGRIGEENTQLLGMLVLSKLSLAAFSRDDVLEQDRKPFYTYVDEFQNFTAGNAGKIFSEARKYGLSLTIAHQYMDQLTDEVRSSVLGNVGSIVVFRVGIHDAEILEKRFSTHFTSKDLSETENLNCVVSMLANGSPAEPFSMQIRFIPKGDTTVLKKVEEYALLNHT